MNSPSYINNKPAVIVSNEEVVEGIDSNNYYWYVYAGDNKGRLTEEQYNNLEENLYIFDEGL